MPQPRTRHFTSEPVNVVGRWQDRGCRTCGCAWETAGAQCVRRPRSAGVLCPGWREPHVEEMEQLTLMWRGSSEGSSGGWGVG